MLEKDKDDIIGFVGSVGDDDFGEVYKKLLIKEDIIPIFESIPNENTGRCLVLCKDLDRAHITDLGASIKISDDFVQNNWNAIKDCSLIFTELYILRDKKNICRDLAEVGLQDNKIYGFNLPAPFFISAHFNDIYDFVQSADIVFTNIDEAGFFVEKIKETQDLGSTNSIEEVIKVLAMLPKKNPSKSRIVVITCGPNPAWVCEYHPQKPNDIYVESFEVMDVPQCNIIDTNGAGDSFAGGFLSQLIKGKSIKESMKAGLWAAHIIIQQRGFQIPLNIHYKNEAS